MTTTIARTWNDLARDIWPDAAYVHGEGRFATVRGCMGQTTVYLHPTVEQARSALRRIHQFWGHNVCELKHVLIELHEGPTDG